MPFDGNGNWTSNFSAVADRDANIKILASRFDGIFLADIAQSFENCLTKDMQVKPQQAFNANNYRMINVADPVDVKDAVNLQTLDGKDALCVHKAGTEEITGDKTLSGSNTFSGSVSLNGTIGGSNSVKETITGWGMPNYSSGIDISSGYVASANGLLVFEAGGQGDRILYINGQQVYRYNWSASYGNPDHITYPVSKGSTITYSGSFGMHKFYPCLGG